MDVEAKLQTLGRAARFDVCQAADRAGDEGRLDLSGCVFRAVRSCGGTTPLLKVLQSNVCERDCAYCANRSGRDVRRVTLSPDELAASFDAMQRASVVEGLFLSSGLCGHADGAMERMIATVRLLRTRYAFGGYVHLKILPGADRAAIEEAISLADRVSVNLEAPNPQRLQALSHTKDYGRELWYALVAAAALREGAPRRVSMTTQFVVGAAGESDAELLATAQRLYREVRLARVYYSAFRPISDTPLEGHPPAPAWRQNRLYQADMLLSRYRFAAEELPYDDAGMLARDRDPKAAWARLHPERYPLEVNTAGREELLRIPGIGPLSADRILERRRRGRLRDLGDLGCTGACARRAAPFVLLDGRRPDYQLPLL